MYVVRGEPIKVSLLARYVFVVLYMVPELGFFLQFEENWTYLVIQTDETENVLLGLKKKGHAKAVSRFKD